MRPSYLAAFLLAFAVAYFDVSFVSAITLEKFRNRFRRKQRRSNSPSEENKSVLGKRKRGADVEDDDDGHGEAKKTKMSKFRFKLKGKKKHKNRRKKKKNWLKRNFGKKHKKSQQNDDAQDDEVHDMSRYNDLKETLSTEIADDIKENPLLKGFKDLSDSASAVKNKLIHALDDDIAREINKFVPQIAVAA